MKSLCNTKYFGNKKSYHFLFSVKPFAEQELKPRIFYVKSVTYSASFYMNYSFFLFPSNHLHFQNKNSKHEFLREINYSASFYILLFSFFCQTIFRTRTKNPECYVKPFIVLFENYAFFRQTIFRTRTQRPGFFRETICINALQIMFFSVKSILIYVARASVK